MTDLRKAAEIALEAIESAINAGDWKVDGACDPDMAIHALRQALAQPEQEPVAWMSIDCIGERYLCFSKPTDNDKIQPLYTAPPKQWVGLTDAEVAKTMHGSVEGSNMLPYQFARAIEAKLREKNCVGVKD